MAEPITVPAVLVDILAKAGMADWDWETLRTASDMAPETAERLRLLVQPRRRNFALQEFVRSLIPESLVRCGEDQMMVCPRDNYTDYVVWLTGHSPEPASVAALSAAVLEEPCLILDIGANSGVYTLPLARLAVPGSSVIAFEPNPVMAGRLRRNLALNGLADRVEIHQTAISADVGEAMLFLAGANFGEASLDGRTRSEDHALTVQTAPLINFVDPNERREIVLKIDVEGHEDSALLPYLRAASANVLPKVMLIETRHKAKWRLGLSEELRSRNYHSILKIEGNTLFLLGN